MTTNRQIRQLLTELLALLRQLLERNNALMSTLADLTAADTELATEVAAVITQLDTVEQSLQQLQNGGTVLSPADQAALDAAVQATNVASVSLKGALPGNEPTGTT